jgi:isocitrate dehydrogenase (NAD+)
MIPRVVVMRGDGIGPLVVAEAMRVLDAAGFEADWIEADIGWEFWRREGNALPDRTVRLLEAHRVALFGAITSKPKDVAERELDVHLRGRGLRYVSPVLAMRQRLRLETCIRPCRTLEGNPLGYIRRGASGAIESPRIDVTLVTQNTECLYSSVEWTSPPPELRAALDAHPEMRARFDGVASADLAISCRITSRSACERIADAAFAYAASHGYSSVTVCDKWGVMRETSAMLLAAAENAAARHPAILLARTDFDAQVMWIVRRPERFGVILSSAIVGDVLSDGFAGLVGGLGFACSANLGERCAVFEPTHGSAPKHAAITPSLVNPIATILAAAMMLDHLGDARRAAHVRDAVARVVRQGRVRTYDLLALEGDARAVSLGAATTHEMGDAVIDALRAARA